jgi:hypothetical protein
MTRSILLALALLAAAPALAQQPPQEATVAILGEPVVGPDGKALGRLIDVIVDASGAPLSAAIDFGGFIGIGSRKIVVPWSALRFAPQASNRPITLEMTAEQIKAAPDYKPTGSPPPAAPPPPAPAPTPPAPTPPAQSP